MNDGTRSTPPVCDHGFPPGACPEDLCLHRREVKNALLGLVGAMTAAGDQAQAMTDAELGALLLSGGWSTIEVHEAGRRLSAPKCSCFEAGRNHGCPAHGSTAGDIGA